MKGRLFATFGCFAIGGWLLTGCAGNQTLSDGVDSFDFGNRPQVLIAGATHSDVKGLAMGAARSKGWTIVKSTDDLLVMQRPLDPIAPSAAALGTAKSTVPPVVEVTAAFRDQSGGINVALAAALITQPLGETAPKRADYTENYRDALTQSLESLRANCAANRQRVANAIPPQSPSPEPFPLDTPPGAGPTNPPVQAWGETAEKPDPSARTTPTPARVTLPTPEQRIPDPAAAPTAPEPKDDRASAMRPPQSGTSPAPVVDGSSALTARAPAPISTSPALPQPEPEPVALQNNMLTLSPASGAGIWAYNAEQYARLRGCAVTDAGTQLIESRVDGELYKVACVGSNSYLLKCQNGICRELAPVERQSASSKPMATSVNPRNAQLEPRATRTEVKAAKPESNTAKADSHTGTPAVKTAKADSKTVKPDTKTAKADSKVAKPEPKTAKADSKAAKPEPKTAKADSKAAKPEPKTAKADSKAAKPEPKTAKADSKAAKPEPKTAKADSKAAKSEPKTAKADSKAARSEGKIAKAEKSEGPPGNSKHHVVKPH